MVDWFAGKRVRGTSSERSGFGLSLGGTGVGGWVELARTTLGGTSDSIDVTSLPDKRYYMVLSNCLTDGSGNILVAHRYNGDSGYNYQWRYSIDGGSDSIGNANLEEHISTAAINDNSDKFSVSYIANKSDKEKLEIAWGVGRNTAGAGTAPRRSEHVGKWVNTSNAINRIYTFERGQSGTYATGSEVVVLGYDPADTHTTNFWQELASVELGSNNSTLSSGTFSAKKYLWVQIYVKGLASSGSHILKFNNDSTASSYSWRSSYNGGADATVINRGKWDIQANQNLTTPIFTNMFIVNNSANEKLGMWNTVIQSTAGAGTSPHREEGVGKFTPTGSQITKIDVTEFNGSINLLAGSKIKVWGAD